MKNISEEEYEHYFHKWLYYYGGASDVPEPIVQAIKLLTTHLYENREAVTSLGVNAIPYTIGAMLQPYRILRSQAILGG